MGTIPFDILRDLRGVQGCEDWRPESEAPQFGLGSTCDCLAPLQGLPLAYKKAPRYNHFSSFLPCLPFLSLLVFTLPIVPPSDCGFQLVFLGRLSVLYSWITFRLPQRIRYPSPWDCSLPKYWIRRLQAKRIVLSTATFQHYTQILNLNQHITRNRLVDKEVAPHRFPCTPSSTGCPLFHQFLFNHGQVQSIPIYSRESGNRQQCCKHNSGQREGSPPQAPFLL